MASTVYETKICIAVPSDPLEEKKSNEIFRTCQLFTETVLSGKKKTLLSFALMEFY